MDVRIGVSQAPKELQIEIGDDVERDRLVAEVEAALSGESAVLWLTDRKGRRIAIPAAKVAYVEIGSPDEARRVGFGTH